jgi:hypothetical protein
MDLLEWNLRKKREACWVAWEENCLISNTLPAGHLLIHRICVLFDLLFMLNTVSIHEVRPIFSIKPTYLVDLAENLSSLTVRSNLVQSISWFTWPIILAGGLKKTNLIGLLKSSYRPYQNLRKVEELKFPAPGLDSGRCFRVHTNCIANDSGLRLSTL